jgi:hypothetical protein
MNIINDNKPRLPSAGIVELEDKIGKRLPVEYVNFLENHNGGQPLENKFHIPDCDSDSLIDHFLGMGRPSEEYSGGNLSSYKVAASFDDFISSIVVEDESEE